MRLLTYLADGERRLGALVGDQVVDLAAAQAARTGGSGCNRGYAGIDRGRTGRLGAAGERSGHKLT